MELTKEEKAIVEWLSKSQVLLIHQLNQIKQMADELNLPVNTLQEAIYTSIIRYSEHLINVIKSGSLNK